MIPGITGVLANSFRYPPGKTRHFYYVDARLRCQVQLRFVRPCHATFAEAPTGIHSLPAFLPTKIHAVSNLLKSPGKHVLGFAVRLRR